nr:PREDICTED: EF-hand calcium-binding domain-containing protein 11 isoform X3 [Lepisosteus oculatus]
MFSYKTSLGRQEPKISETDIKKFTSVFQQCDESKKGYLDREDLKIAIVMLFGYKPSKSETDLLLHPVLQANLPGRGFLTLEDFRKAFSSVAHLQDQTVQEAFREVDRDSDGHISFKDLESVLTYGQDDR